MAKALYFDVLQYTAENLRLLRDAFEVKRLPNPDHCTDAALSDVEVVFAPLGYAFDGAFMRRAPKLKVLATNTTGVPHIDETRAKALGIEVISLAGDSEFLDAITPTAELAVGLMVAITRNVLTAFDAVKAGVWRRWDHGGTRMLSRMQLGIVGFGRLGKMMATRAGAMGMGVTFYDPYLGAVDSEFAACGRRESLEALVGNADVVSLHASVNSANRHMFNERVFAAFRPGGYFVNTARGELVDSHALSAVLRSGHLAGAALDVLDGEFEPGFQERMDDDPLVVYARSHANLLLTPHIGGSTRDAWALTQERTIRKAIAAAARSAT